MIANLRGWFDASNAAGVTQTGGVVASWNDLSGNANSVVQSSASAEPTLVSSGINNLPTLAFNGAQYLVGSSPFSSNLFNESTVFIVADQSSAHENEAIVWSGPGATSPRYKVALTTSTSVASKTQFDLNSRTGGEIGTTQTVVGPAIWTAAGSFSTHQQFFRRDGTTTTSSSGPTTGASGSYPLAFGTMLSSSAPSNYYAGRLGEVLIFNRLLSASEYTEVEGYLSCKWGLQSQLPASHPYATVCPGGASPLAISPSTLTFVAPTAAAANATVSGGTPPYVVSACSNAAVATLAISGTTLAVKPQAVGRCNATVTDAASTTTTVSIVVNAPATGFTPSQVAGLHGWFDASNPASVAAVGGQVQNWTDVSGSNNSLAAVKSSAAPMFVASGINGLGSVSFNGSQYLASANLGFSSDLFNETTVFAVTNQATALENNAIVWSGSSAVSPRFKLALSTSSSAVTKPQFDFNSRTGGEIGHSQTITGPAIWTAAGSISSQMQFFRRDGITFASGAGPGATVSGSYPLYIGAMVSSTGPGNYYNGQLGELLIFDRLLSASEYTEVEGFLACKWGLQGQLPANHPYAATCPQGAPASTSLSDPPQLRSTNGTLSLTLTTNQDANGAPQLTYNGSPVPPTLRVLPGDTLNVTLVNNLPAPPAGATYFNDTNLHFHGLHVSPNAPGDDSIDVIAMPGQTIPYKVVIPANHPTGLYWYHSHAHGEAERQNLSGMSGALIVDGISSTYPAVASMPERIIVARDAVPVGGVLPAANRKQVAAMFWAMQHRSSAGAVRVSLGRTSRILPTTMRGPAMHGMSMDVPVRGRSNRQTRNPYVTVDPNYRRFIRPKVASSHCTVAETPDKTWTLNGQKAPSIGIRPGEQQFWRVVNAGSDSYLDLALDGSNLQIVALDGVPLASPIVASDWILPPASRAEFIVTGPPAGTNATFHTNCYDGGSTAAAMPAAVLATLDQSATALARRHRATASHRDRTNGFTARSAVLVRAPHTARWLRTAAITGPAQTVNYSDQNTINGSAYDPGAPPLFYAQSGTIAEWTIVNVSQQVHTFHMHQVHFLVEQVVGGNASDQATVGQMIDNVSVPPSNANGPGTVRVKIDFTDPLIIGTFLVHCHILSHEDQGMMAKIRVGLAPPITVDTAQVHFASSTAPAQTVHVSGGSPGANGYSLSGCTLVNATATGGAVSISPLASGSCGLTIADTTGLSVTVNVIVAAQQSPVAASPNVLAFATPGSPAENTTISGGTAPYSAAGCDPSIATAAIAGTTLTVTAHRAGQCTVTVSDATSASANVAIQIQGFVGGLPMENITFHHDAGRSGWYQAETQLTTANIASSSFGRLGSLQAPAGATPFGKVYAQPLFITNESTADGSSHNLVIVSTTTDQVYAFDDRTNAVVWQRSFTGPGVTAQQSSTIGCHDVTPNIGITGTPVIDRNLDEMFVVVPTVDNGVAHMRLHAISLASGADLASTEVSASNSTSNNGVATTSPIHNFNRSALLEANGNIYVGLGSHCDYVANSTHGWILAYTTSLVKSGFPIDLTNGQPDTSSHFLGSVWMGGFGPAADASGNIYFSTGNGPYDGASNFAMSVLGFPGNLDITRATWFTPHGESGDSDSDRDLGSGGVMLLPDGLSSAFPHLLIQGGKSASAGARKYVLNRDALGGFDPTDAGALSRTDTHVGIFGGPARYQDPAGNTIIMYSGRPSGNVQQIGAYRFDPTNFSLTGQSFTPLSVGNCFECRDDGAQPIVSSNASQPGTAVLWALQTPNGFTGNITLFAFDANNLATQLYSGVAGNWQAEAGQGIGGALVSPLVANGRVYVPTDGSVAVFGLH